MRQQKSENKKGEFNKDSKRRVGKSKPERKVEEKKTSSRGANKKTGSTPLSSKPSSRTSSASKPSLRTTSRPFSPRSASKSDESTPSFEKPVSSRPTTKKFTRSIPKSISKTSDNIVKPVEKKTASKRENNGDIRLNKYIANAGICSRRDADKYIQAGLVSVNGVIISEMGYKVKADDDVRYNDERLKSEKKVYVILNKPKDFVTTMDDPHAEKTVMDLVRNACSERIYPVGRLDKSTTGLLLFTNDGDMAKKLTHPKYHQKKIYHVFLDKNVSVPDLFKLTEGVRIEDDLVVSADAANHALGQKDEVGIEIHSGENRVVRRMFEALGYRVKKLDRVYFAGLTKKNLKRGQWRFLTEAEINMLKIQTGQ